MSLCRYVREAEAWFPLVLRWWVGVECTVAGLVIVLYAGPPGAIAEGQG